MQSRSAHSKVTILQAALQCSLRRSGDGGAVYNQRHHASAVLLLMVAVAFRMLGDAVCTGPVGFGMCKVQRSDKIRRHSRVAEQAFTPCFGNAGMVTCDLLPHCRESMIKGTQIRRGAWNATTVSRVQKGKV